MDSDKSSQMSDDKNDQESWKLYLGGIPVEADEAELTEALESLMADFKVTIMKNPEQGNSKGCGFVDVFNKADFKRLLKAKIVIREKTLQIEEYIVDEEQRKKRMFENNEKSIHVGSLPPEAGNDDLENYFSQFGKVSRAYVIYTLGEEKKSREFGFVQFVSKKSAKKVLLQAKHIILGKEIKVTQRHTKNEIKSGKHKDSTKAPSIAGANSSTKSGKGKKSKKGSTKNKSFKELQKAELPKSTLSVNSGFKSDSTYGKQPFNLMAPQHPQSIHSGKSGRSGNKVPAPFPPNWNNSAYPIISKEVIQGKLQDMRQMPQSYYHPMAGYYPPQQQMGGQNQPMQPSMPQSNQQYEGMARGGFDYSQMPHPYYQGFTNDKYYSGHTMPQMPQYSQKGFQDQPEGESNTNQSGIQYFPGQGPMYYPGQFPPGYFPDGYTVRSQPVKVNSKAANFTYNAETGPNPFSKGHRDAASFHPRYKPAPTNIDPYMQQGLQPRPAPPRQMMPPQMMAPQQAPAMPRPGFETHHDVRMQKDLYKLIESSGDEH